MKISAVLDSAARGLIPFASTIRRLKRRGLPYTDNVGNSYYCIDHGIRQIRALSESGVRIEGARVLEFGCGWLPLIPLLFSLAGAREVVMTDIDHLMDDQTVALAKQRIAERASDICEGLGCTPTEIDATLRSFSPNYQAPWNPYSHPTDDIDILVSRAVLEHVPAQDLERLFPRFLRILVPGGVCCHIVDNSDHWEHKDKSLSRVNFLRYEEREIIWRLAQLNVQSFQNRLRHSDYLSMLQKAGFMIVADHGEPDPASIKAIATMRVAKPFLNKRPDDLCTLESLIIARKPDATLTSSETARHVPDV